MQSNDMELGSCLELPKLKRIKNYLRSIMTEDSMKLHHPWTIATLMDMDPFTSASTSQRQNRTSFQ